MTRTITVDDDVERQFWQRVTIDDGCWPWKTNLSNCGYGRLGYGGEKYLAHRIMYQLFNGPVPEGLDVDHQCHNEDPACLGGRTCKHRACVNPSHLIADTRRENLLKGVTIPSRLASRTSCDSGHEFTPENTWFTKEGYRRCKTCRAQHHAAWYQRRKAETSKP